MARNYSEAGKGSSRRPGKGYADGWDAIWGKKMKWQPIETAPRDGTMVLLLLDSPRNTISASFSNGRWVDCWCRHVAPYVPIRWMPEPEPLEIN